MNQNLLKMKLAIHNGKDKKISWNTRWIKYCEKNSIPFIGVDCYSSDIIEILQKEHVTHLMWAFSLALPKDHIMAKSVMNAANVMGIKTFPNFQSCWHFEDKVAQKYFLEAIGAPVVKSWTFYDKSKAEDFTKIATYPMVAKLRKGAGSKNVKLLNNRRDALNYIKKMFGKGFSPAQSLGSITKQKSSELLKSGKKVSPSFLYHKIVSFLRRRRLFQNESGYVYFQEFLPGNTNDLRIAIVGDRAWGFFRGVRKNDFRASGSGIIDYDTQIPIDVVKESFQITRRMGTQSLCFDYVKAQDGTYKIVEICYGYVSEAIYKCNGFWDSNMVFHKAHLMPDECILEDFIKS